MLGRRFQTTLACLVMVVGGVGLTRVVKWTTGGELATAFGGVVQNKPPRPHAPPRPAERHHHFFLSPAELQQNVTAAFAEVSKRPPLCCREQIIRGKWIPDKLPRPPYITPTVHLRCYPEEFYRKKEPWDTYRWQPNDQARNRICAFTDWERDRFCGLLSGATVSIVGDSLSWEHYSSLIQLNGQRTRQGYQHQSRELHMNIGQPVCDGYTRIVYRRDDKLQNITAAIQENFPTVLVLNRGAHYVNDTLLLRDIQRNIEEVREWLDKCQTVYSVKCHFFWRTSVPGHPECGTFSEPNNDLETMEARVADKSFYDERSIKFHWYDYQHQNNLVLQALEDSRIEYEVIDAYYLNMRRPDEHRAHQNDCLHNCYPGKMDVYSQLLLHYLRRDRTRKDMLQAEKVAKQQEWDLNETTKYDKEATEKAKQIRTGGN